MAEIYLARHGETEANAEGRVQGWLDPPLNGRHIECRGDSATMTEWAPPFTRRCDARGCAPIPLPAISGSNDDELASDGVTLYQLERRDQAIVLAIHSIPTNLRRLVPIIDAGVAGWGFTGSLDRGVIHASRGKVILALQRKADRRPIVVAVDRDGTTHVLAAGE